MSKKTLLLNSTYEVLSFIPERKAIGLLCKEKVDVISEWEESIRFPSGTIKHPSILRLKYHIKKNYTTLSFSRKAVLRRDNYVCQYCSKNLKPIQATIDHIIPKSQGGGTSFLNCVTACYPCNNRKANRTPELADMILKSKPFVPTGYFYFFGDNEIWHPDWNFYVKVK